MRRFAIQLQMVLTVSLGGTLGAQLQPLELHRLTGAVAIDGHPDEAAWRAIDPLPVTMYTPVFRGAPTQRTEIRVAYDDECLSIALTWRRDYIDTGDAKRGNSFSFRIAFRNLGF